STPTRVPTNTPTSIPGATSTSTPANTATPTATATSLPPTSFSKQFGLNAHLTRNDLSHARIDLDRANDAALTTVRFDLSWGALEPVRGSYDQAYLKKLDATLNLIASRNMQPLAVLMDTPAWARGNAGSGNTPPTNPQDYADA